MKLGGVIDICFLLILKFCGKEGQSHIFGGSKGVGVTIESYGKFEIVVPEICRGQVHGPRKERE
jgi:hypothetical protein